MDNTEIYSNWAEKSQLRNWGKRNIPDVWELYWKTSYEVKNIWFSLHHSEVSVTSRAQYIRQQPYILYKTIDTSKQPIKFPQIYLQYHRH